MKRNFAFAALLAAALWPAQAQDTVAEREQAEERHRNVTSRLEKLEEGMAAHHKSVDKLADEVRKLRDEIDRLKNKNESAATQDSFKRLQEAITEVDKKRMADNERTVKSFEELRKLILEKPSAAAPPRNSTPPVNPGPGGQRPPGVSPPAIPDKGYKYAIRANDTLSALVKALRAQGHKVTEKIIMDANPGVNWNRLRIGQEIFIPETR